MNIHPALSSLTSQAITTPTRNAPAKTATDVELPGNKSIPTLENAEKQPVVVSDKTAFAKALYEYEEAPWEHEIRPTLSGELEIGEISKDSYIQVQRIEAMAYLGFVGHAYHHFSKNLQYTHPELAEKYYSFTLADDGKIKILDPEKKLTIIEKEWLTEKLNKDDYLKGNVQRHAKKLMTLVDHDTETFGKRYDLNLDNFHRVVDYVELLGKGPFTRVPDYRQLHKTVLINNIMERADRRTGGLDVTA